MPDVLVSDPDVEPPFSPIAPDLLSASVDSPDDVLLISPLVDVGTDSVPDVIRPVAPSPTMEQLFAPYRQWAPVAVLSPGIDDRRKTPVALSGIRRIAVRTMTCLRGSLDCRCIIRGSLSGSGFRSPPAFWRWAPVGGWIICHVIRPLLPPYHCNEMLVSCKPTLTFWTNIRRHCRGRRRD